jgi:hypothetical protein
VINPTLDFIGTAQACCMYFDVPSGEVIDGHCVSGAARIAALGYLRLGVEGKRTGIGE